MYLSTAINFLDNFELIAKNNVLVTKDYAEAAENLRQSQASIKIAALKVTAIALVALGALVALTVNVIPGILLGSLTAFPLIGIKYLKDKEQSFINHLNQKAEDIEFIFNGIISHLDEAYHQKYAYIHTTFNIRYKVAYTNNIQYFNVGEAYERVKTLAQEYDAKQQQNSSGEYSKLYKFAKLILQRRETPSIISESKWSNLVKACQTFYYGKDGHAQTSYVNLSNDGDFWIVRSV
jgi:hypothetical protein